MKFRDDYQVPYTAENMRPILPPDEQMKKVAEAFSNIAETIIETLTPTLKALIEYLSTFSKLMLDAVKTYPNKRVVYLALHGKPRVRKKNIKRIMKWIERNKNDNT